MRIKLTHVTVVVWAVLLLSGGPAQSQICVHYPLSLGLHSEFGSQDHPEPYRFFTITGYEDFHGQMTWVERQDQDTYDPDFRYYSVDAGGGLLLHGEGTSTSEKVYSPPLMLIPAPIISGQTWSQDFVANLYQGGELVGSLESTFNGEILSSGTQITVPAGTYYAVHIQHSGGVDDEIIDSWYVEDIGRIQYQLFLVSELEL